MRSRTGCLTCRNRKLKCDERKPICGQCTKASRECVPSPGVVFRHQQNASMNGGAEGSSTSSLNRFYGYKETFGKDSIWVDVPQQLTFVHTTNPYDETNSPDFHRILDAREPDLQHVHNRHVLGAYSTPINQGPTHGLEALSAAASGDHYFQASIRRPSIPAPSPSIQQSTAQATNYLLNHSSCVSPPIDPRLNSDLSDVSQVASSALYVTRQVPTEEDIDPATDEDVPFLLRYFSEGPGEWMDLFDLGSFFAVDVPLKASYCPLLLYAAIALSAKALGRIRITAQHPKNLGSKRTPSEWSHKARHYYDKAITQLRQALENETRAVSDPPGIRPVSPGSVGDIHQPVSPFASKNATYDSQGLPRTDSDELVATTAILCVYEFLDASGLEWTRHLAGAKSLFDIAKDGTMPLSVLSPESPPLNMQPSTTTKGRRTVFWNICRQEMLNAFINNTNTRLDTADLSTWRSAGLHISQAGFILPSNDPALHEPMADDMISNALVWLMMKLINFIADGDDFPDELGLGIRQTQLLEYWEGLEKQLDVWFEGLPNSFRPSATEWQDRNRTRIPRKWFARPMCASTMQSFHFARIQLLLNKPHISTGASHVGSPDAPPRGTTWSLAQRHASYASILRQSRKHAEEIISIGLGLTNDGARIHSVQPLYTAGQVLGMREGAGKPTQTEEVTPSDETDEQRSCILNLLQNIQRETGWATEYRMQQLLEEWGLPSGQT